MSKQKNILVAPLDWGLGHATRCMPMIDILLQHQHNVIIAGNGDSLLLLKETYPSLIFVELPAYNIQYKVGSNAAIQSLLQAPKIWKTIQHEYQVTQQIVTQYKIDVIISDNRYGVRHEQVKSIFMCHQIALQAPSPFQFSNSFFLKMHLRQIQKFDALWIPDNEDENNLSGILSHHIDFKIPHTYIGIQSRFSNYVKAPSFIDALDFDILVVLSGVEPQRTYLEQQLISVFQKRKEKVLLIQGKTDAFIQKQVNNITLISYLQTNDLFTALQKAPLVICRSGYSSVMDLAVLGKKAIFIPAEGQTEQEYLANSLEKNGFSITCKQAILNIDAALNHIKNCNGFGKLSADNQQLFKLIQSL